MHIHIYIHLYITYICIANYPDRLVILMWHTTHICSLSNQLQILYLGFRTCCIINTTSLKMIKMAGARLGSKAKQPLSEWHLWQWQALIWSNRAWLRLASKCNFSFTSSTGDGLFCLLFLNGTIHLPSLMSTECGGKLSPGVQFFFHVPEQKYLSAFKDLLVTLVLIVYYSK